MIDGRNVFDQTIKMIYKHMITLKKIQDNGSTTRFLLDYSYVKEYYKLLAIDSVKLEKLDAYPKVIQQVNFIGNLENNTTKYFIIDEGTETVLDFGCLLLFRQHPMKSL